MRIEFPNAPSHRPFGASGHRFLSIRRLLPSLNPPRTEPPAMRTSGFLPRHAVLALAGFLFASPATALAPRLGGSFAEGPGGWLQVRHAFWGTEVGGHLAASATPVRAREDDRTFIWATYQKTWTTFLEWGLVVNRPLLHPGPWVIGISTGVLGGYLFNVRGHWEDSNSMILVPAFVEADWHLMPSHPRFALTFAGGLVHTSPADKEDLYDDLDRLRWQGRAGVVF